MKLGQIFADRFKATHTQPRPLDTSSALGWVVEPLDEPLGRPDDLRLSGLRPGIGAAVQDMESRQTDDPPVERHSRRAGQAQAAGDRVKRVGLVDDHLHAGHLDGHLVGVRLAEIDEAHDRLADRQFGVLGEFQRRQLWCRRVRDAQKRNLGRVVLAEILGLESLQAVVSGDDDLKIVVLVD